MTPSHRTREMKRPRFQALLIPLFLFGQLSAAETWTLVKPAVRVTFSVLMPTQAVKQSGKDEWRSQDEAGCVYTATMGFYVEPKIKDTDEFMKTFIANLAQNTQSRVAYSWFFKAQHAPACEFKLMKKGDNRLSVIRYFLVGQYFYLLDYVATTESFNLKNMKKFFDSFQMFNPELGGL